MTQKQVIKTVPKFSTEVRRETDCKKILLLYTTPTPTQKPYYFPLSKFKIHSAIRSYFSSLTQPWNPRVVRIQPKSPLNNDVSVYYTTRGCVTTSIQTTIAIPKLLIALGLFGINSKPPALLIGNNNISTFFMLSQCSQ
jgi:hypothetical protein